MCPNPQETAGLIKFTEKILNGKPDFLCRFCTSHKFAICHSSYCQKGLFMKITSLKIRWKQKNKPNQMNQITFYLDISINFVLDVGIEFQFI